MPQQSIRFINQTAPFWDFIASMEEGEHPFFGRQGPGQGQGESSRHPRHRGGWGQHGPHQGGPFSHEDIPHRGGPPHHQEAADNESSAETVQANEKDAAKDVDMEKGATGEDTGAPDPPEDTPNDGSPSGDERRRRWGHGKHRRCHKGGENGERSGCERGERSGDEGRGWGRRCGGGGPGARGFGGPWGGRHGRGHHGPRGFGFGPFGQIPDFNMLSSLFQGANADNANDDWAPEADVFDTPDSYIVHVSLPGAKKEDIGVTWEPERSELIIAGVVHRPGNEEFLKTIAMDERKVGAFERKILLGTRANPAHVDVDGIFAKHDNGILIIEVPKMTVEDFVEVKKIDIE